MSGRTNTRTGGKSMNTSNVLLVALLILALAAFAWSFFNYQSVKKEVEVLKDPSLAQRLNEEQTQELLTKVGKVLVLPQEKNPVVAIINDVELLASNQDFYKDAHDGDKLIIYQNARKAIIFDEDANKVVNVGPVFYNNADGTAQPPTTQTDRITIDLRNGSAEPNATVPVRDSLTTNYTFNVTRLSKAANSNYSGITIVDLSEGKASYIEQLQKALGATVVQALPEGEVSASTEVVVIVGTTNK